MTRTIALLLLACAAPLWAAEPVHDAQRARLNYMLNCQGCHLPDGQGIADTVPTLHDFVGRFLSVPGGREYLVQVPGSANAALDDAALADLLNWLLVTLSPAQLPEHWQPYSAEEVGRLRASPLSEVQQTRAALVARMPLD
ncbi:MAG: hypothetical protein R3E86_20725 [Pseudomonadales bacterium]